MAILSTIICDSCGKEKSVTHSASRGPPSVCGQCRDIAADKDKKEFLHGLAKMPLKKRIERLESLLYDEGMKPPPFDGYGGLIG
jgi:hypothetical protein